MERDTLLVIDDSPLDLAILTEIFKSLFHVECFEESRPALAYIHRNPDRICGVLLDICLGRRGAGFLVLQQLQLAPSTAQLPVILMTTDPSEEYVINAVNKGAVDFLVKPVDPQTVQERVCSVVRRAWPAGATILDGPAQPEPEEEAREETQGGEPAPSLAQRWVRLLELFFQSKPAFSLSRYRLLSKCTAILAESYRKEFPGCGLTAEQAVLVGQAAMFCDIGMLGLPDAVVEQGEEQSGADREVYFRHTALGHALFATGLTGERELTGYAAQIAYWHHKNVDGSGFPMEETAEPIPLCAQLTRAAWRCLEYMDYFRGCGDRFERALRTMSGDVGRIISREMYDAIQAAQDKLSRLFQAEALGQEELEEL